MAHGGDDYAHRVAAWLGTRLLAGVGAPPVTPEASGPLTRVSLDTGLVVAETATGNRAAVQARATLQVAEDADSSFAHRVHELVAHHLDHGGDRLVLAIGPGTKRPARVHLPAYLAAVRAAAPGTGPAELGLRADPRRVGAVFAHHAERSWRELAGAPPTAGELHRLAERLAVVVRDVDGDGHHAGEARRLLRQLVRDPRQVDAAWDALVEILSRLAAQGAGCDQRALQRRLVAAGVELETAPNFRRDVTRLARSTAATRATLERHGLTIPSRSGPVALARAATDALEARLAHASTLVTGEAGVGKTVVLAHLLERLADADVPVLALTAATTPADGPGQLRRQLGVTNDLGSCLAQWDPQRPGVLAVDGLHEADEAQTSTWHSVMRAASRAGWRVVAVDRLAHVRHAGGLRSLFPAATGSERDHTLGELDGTHHVHVTGLTDAELAALVEQAPEFRALLDDPPAGLLEVLRTPFNLRLAGELLRTDVDERTLRGIRSRLELLQQYSTWVATPPGTGRDRSRQEHPPDRPSPPDRPPPPDGTAESPSARRRRW